MNGRFSIARGALAAGMLLASQFALAAFNSGSTGADGAFNPTQSQTVQLPPNGIFNFTSVNIPAGVTIKFAKNAANTPVTILASGDVTVAGTIDVSAAPPADSSNFSGPGQGGPGGYDGGRGGQAGGDASNWATGLTSANIGRNGVGPGGGGPGRVWRPGTYGYPVSITSGGGGAFGSAPNGPSGNCPVGSVGATYGNVSLLPLVGGSGGGGGVGGSSYPGSGGGGGGGAILIAASGTINVTGSILANGGVPPGTSAAGRGAQGGGGSGGAIRLVATTIGGNGTISAVGGGVAGEGAYISNAGSPYYICNPSDSNYSLSGGAGRIRLESETLLRTTATSPYYVGGAPGLLFVPNSPAISIASIGGLPVPATPTGNGDVSLPPEVSNPVAVVIKTSGVTVGSTIKLTVAPAIGAAYSATSAPTTGTTDNATASVNIDIPSGQSILQASVTYTVVAAVGDAMSVYAQGERVEKVRLSTTLGGDSMATLITVSGREYEVPASVLAMGQG